MAVVVPQCAMVAPSSVHVSRICRPTPACLPPASSANRGFVCDTQAHRRRSYWYPPMGGDAKVLIWEASQSGGRRACRKRTGRRPARTARSAQHGRSHITRREGSWPTRLACRHPHRLLYRWRRMRRRIDGWQQDEAADWVALLDCGHRRHVRHRPPLWPNPWVGQEEGRTAHLGTPLDCPLCDRGEPPGVAAAATAGLEPSAAPADLGGEAACLANLICPHCDAVVGDGGHRPPCPAAPGTGTAGT